MYKLADVRGGHADNGEVSSGCSLAEAPNEAERSPSGEDTVAGFDVRYGARLIFEEARVHHTGAERSPTVSPEGSPQRQDTAASEPDVGIAQARRRRTLPYIGLKRQGADLGSSPLHPEEIDFSGHGKAGAGLKHSYTIMFARWQAEGRLPLGTWMMSESLMCDQRTGRDRVDALEAMGLVVAYDGTSVWNDDPQDDPTRYQLTRPSDRSVLRSDPPQSCIPFFTMYYLKAMSAMGHAQYILEKYEDYLYRSRQNNLREMGPEWFLPDEDRWRWDRYGAVGWLMTQTELVSFTVAEMAEAVGCDVGPKAVRRVLRLMMDNGDAEEASGRGRYQLSLRPWVPVETYEAMEDVVADFGCPDLVGPFLEAFMLFSEADESKRDDQSYALTLRRNRQREKVEKDAQRKHPMSDEESAARFAAMSFSDLTAPRPQVQPRP